MASGNTLLIFTPYNNEPPSANHATLDTRNGHPTLDFNESADEEAIFSAVMPRAYTGGGLTVYLHTAYTTAVAGDAYWDAAIERIGDSQQDIDSDGFAAAQTMNLTVPGTSGHVTIDAITFTDGAQMDSVAVGELFRIKIRRDADHGSDDASGDGELLAVGIIET